MDLLVQIRKEVDVAACCTAWCTDIKKFNVKKPCCGYTLHNGLVAIAILDVIGAVLAILPLVIMLVSVTVFRDLMQSIREDLSLLPMDSAKTVEKSFTMFLSILTLVISVSLLEFYLAMLLLHQKKLTSCYKWWRLVVVVLIAILFGISSIIIEAYRIPLLVLGCILCGYKMYCYWIVTLYIATIGTMEKDSEMTLPTVCSEIDNFTQI
ncbi:uncharacterized protein LOC110854283 [Folsomia candida]|uniref:uncharacterized protein LOC110854283 n=1 Tax=Folsomia candida TaxID=158441 RepID=UPI001604A672|nr:uncharacterized protein LOC110854283 [Folsomia candida]